VNNVAIGEIQCATTVGATSTKVDPDNFGSGITSGGAATNTGWSKFPDMSSYTGALNLVKAA
jgi:hypothetical protein